jgi:hypothetical protein
VQLLPQPPPLLPSKLLPPNRYRCSISMLVQPPSSVPEEKTRKAGKTKKEETNTHDKFFTQSLE